MSVTEAGKDVDVTGSCDVIVCGGGAAGVVAATAAARNGARTLLIERYGFVGGMATKGAASHSCTTRGSRAASSRTAASPTSSCRTRPAASPTRALSSSIAPATPTWFARRVTSASRATCCSPPRSGSSSGVWTRTRSRPCSPTRSTGSCRSPSRSADGSSSSMRPARSRSSGGRGSTGSSTTAWSASTCCARPPTRETPRRSARTGSSMREQLHHIIEVLRREFAEFRDCWLAKSGIQTGVRETCHIVGLYRLQRDDVLHPKAVPAPSLRARTSSTSIPRTATSRTVLWCRAMSTTSPSGAWFLAEASTS